VSTVWILYGDQGFEKVQCRVAVGRIVKPGKGELGRAIHGHEQIQFAFLDVHLGDVEIGNSRSGGP
jgi:hypothetical protein